MAPPVLYVVGGVVITVATVIAFKEFIYDPFIHPHVEAYWERRSGRRMSPAHEDYASPRMLTSGLHDRTRDSDAHARGDVELTDVRSSELRYRRPRMTDEGIHDNSGQGPTRSRSHPRFGLQTPTDSPKVIPDQTRGRNGPGPAEGQLVDLQIVETANPFADEEDNDADMSASPSLRRRSTATSGAEMLSQSVRTRTTRVSTTPSLLRTPPGQHSRPSAPMPGIRPAAPAPHISEDDDDMVLSFTGTRPSQSHNSQDIAMPMPQRQGVAQGSPFVVDSDHEQEHDVRSVSSASVSAFDTVSQPSSRAMSPFVFDGDEIELEPAHMQFSIHRDTSPTIPPADGRTSAPMSSPPPTYASRASPAGPGAHLLAQAFIPPTASSHVSPRAAVSSYPASPPVVPVSPRSQRSDGWSDAALSPAAPMRAPLYPAAHSDAASDDFDFGEVSDANADAPLAQTSPLVALASPRTESSAQSAFSRGITQTQPRASLDVRAAASTSETRPTSVLDVLAQAASVHSDVEADDESPVPGAVLAPGDGRRRVMRVKPRVGRGGEL